MSDKNRPSLTYPAVIAGAVAAATATVLSTRLGLVGTVIGAVVASIVSTLVSTVASPDAARAKSAQAIGRRFAARSDGAQLEKLAMLHASGGLRTHIDAVFALSDVGLALDHSKRGHVRGKIVVDVAQ